MKYCPKCGNALNDEDLFCPRCGERQPAPRDIPASQVSGDAPIEESAEDPVTLTSEPRPARRVGIRDFKARDSIILVAAYIVIYIVFMILNATFFDENAMLGKLGFTFATGAILAIMIMRMVHAINIKNKFLMMLQIAFVALMGSCLIGCIIMLGN